MYAVSSRIIMSVQHQGMSFKGISFKKHDKQVKKTIIFLKMLYWWKNTRKNRKMLCNNNEKITRNFVDQKWPQVNFIMLKFFMVYPYLELHILFYSNGLAIWSGLKKLWQIIGHFGRHDLVSVRILPNFELIRAISELDIWYKFWSETWKSWVNRVNENICRSKVAASRPFSILSCWNFSWYIPTWNCTFCFIVMV